MQGCEVAVAAPHLVEETSQCIKNPWRGRRIAALRGWETWKMASLTILSSEGTALPGKERLADTRTCFVSIFHANSAVRVLVLCVFCFLQAVRLCSKRRAQLTHATSSQPEAPVDSLFQPSL
jgi:hypothetical protein